MNQQNLKARLLETQTTINERFIDYFSSQKIPGQLKEAISYSLLDGGKRIRPLLCLEVAKLFDPAHQAWLPAMAVEMIHCFSLIHDDLPAMDDDDLRRGKPTNHKVFGEGMAVLAGDALYGEAFRILACDDVYSDTQKLQMIQELTRAAGPLGMIGGQALDLLAENKQLNIDEMRQLHQMKTGALLEVSCVLGALAAGASPDQTEKTRQFGACLGLAFQIVDDILDIEGGIEIGKPQKSDVANQKATYPSLFGMAKTKELAQKAMNEAIESLAEFKERASFLREIALYVVNRKK